MQLKSKKYLYDLSQANKKISLFLENTNFDDYSANDLLKSAVERQFEILGEALNQLSKVDQNLVKQVTDYKQIISFRNILIHGYADVDDRLVWNIIETKLPVLSREIKLLLADVCSC